MVRKRGLIKFKMCAECDPLTVVAAIRISALMPRASSRSVSKVCSAELVPSLRRKIVQRNIMALFHDVGLTQGH
jgi:hypothetical protein